MFVLIHTSHYLEFIITIKVNDEVLLLLCTVFPQELLDKAVELVVKDKVEFVVARPSGRSLFRVSNF